MPAARGLAGRWTAPAGRPRPARADLLLDSGPAAHLKPGSLDTCADGYGRWLGWLASEGRLDPDAAPAARVTREEVAAYVAALRRVNAPLTVLGRIADLATVLRWFAPEQDWSWLRSIQARLRVGSARRPRTVSAPGCAARTSCWPSGASYGRCRHRRRPVAAPARPALS